MTGLHMYTAIAFFMLWIAWGHLMNLVDGGNTNDRENARNDAKRS